MGQRKLERVISLPTSWLVSFCWRISVTLQKEGIEGKLMNRIRGGGKDRQRQTVSGLFVAPSLLCNSALPSMWLPVITCSLLCHSQHSDHHSFPLFTSSTLLLSLFTFSFGLSCAFLSDHPSPSLTHHTVTFLGINCFLQKRFSALFSPQWD